MGTEIINRSHEPDWKVRAWFEQAGALAGAKAVVCLPDTCPGRSPLPTGTGYLTDRADWRRFAVSDVGCGTCIVRTRLTAEDVASQGFRESWRGLCEKLRANRNKGLGDLGSGNHFLDAAVSHRDQSVVLVVHTGSRNESGLVDDLVEHGAKFDREFRRIERWAFENREAVLAVAQASLGKFIELYPEEGAKGLARLDRNHNHFEEREDGVLIRKGSQGVKAGELALIPSNLLDDMAVVRANEGVGELFNCLPHGTGRAVSRGDAKQLATAEGMEELRARVFIPETIEDASLRTELPACYRPLDPCLELIADVAEVVERFTPVAYIGQL